MDPITTAIVAALATGLTTGVTQVGESVIPDAYKAIKQTIQDKFGAASKLVQAVNELEAEPDFEANKTALAGRVAQVKADEDPDVLQAAKVLLEAIKNTPQAIAAIGVNLEEVKGAALRIDDITATGTGVNVQKGEFSHVGWVDERDPTFSAGITALSDNPVPLKRAGGLEMCMSPFGGVGGITEPLIDVISLKLA